MSRNRSKRWGRGNQLLSWFKRYFTIYSSRRKYRTQRGIALPLVIGIGLLMMLLSVTIIARSQSSQVSTSNLKQAVQASEVAESGLSRVQELFTQKPFIATVNLSEWVTKDASTPTTACPPGGSISTIPLTDLINKNWITIATDTTATRQFRVVDYTFAQTASNTGIGKLQLEGRITNSSQVLSTSGLQVQIPVNPGNINNIPIPGLWAASQWDSGKGNGLIEGNVIVPCNVATSLANVASGYKARQSNLKLPALPAIPTSPAPINLGSITSTMTLPRIPGDITLADDTIGITKTWGSSPKTYEYQVDEIRGRLTINPNYKVTIYLTGNVDKTSDIFHDNGGQFEATSNNDTFSITSDTGATGFIAGNPIVFSGSSLPTEITVGTNLLYG